MKQKLWLTLVTCLAYCVDKELYEAIVYLREQVRVLVEHQEKQDKRSFVSRGATQTIELVAEDIHAFCKEKSLSVSLYLRAGANVAKHL